MYLGCRCRPSKYRSGKYPARLRPGRCLDGKYRVSKYRRAPVVANTCPCSRCHVSKYRYCRNQRFHKFRCNSSQRPRRQSLAPPHIVLVLHVHWRKIRYQPRLRLRLRSWLPKWRSSHFSGPKFFFALLFGIARCVPPEFVFGLHCNFHTQTRSHSIAAGAAAGFNLSSGRHRAAIVVPLYNTVFIGENSGF